jgi:glycosyltransferase involved in cell wall biosynthesis
MRTLDLLALVPYPLGTTPSQRFRLEQWAPLLASEHGIRVHWSPFADARLAALLTRPGHLAGKAARLALASVARLQDLPRARRHDVVLVHRAACLAGPAWLERVLARLGRPLVFDFDDAIWLRHTSGANAFFDRLKFPGKTATLCRIASLVVAGCGYLADYARRHNERTVVVPTSIDTDAYAPRAHRENGRVVVGWTGSATSLTHLEAFAPVLRTLLAQRPVELRVLSTREPDLPGVPAVFRRWTPQNEVEEIRAFDIGIKPMPDDPWARGKCPMKELQYLALGVPAVCSDVGTAGEAVRPGENGFLATTPDEWTDRLVRLVDDPALRTRMGEAGRRTVVERYSAAASARAFASAVRALVERA